MVKVKSDESDNYRLARLTKRDFLTLASLEQRVREIFSDRFKPSEKLILDINIGELDMLYHNVPDLVPLTKYNGSFLILTDADVFWIWEDLASVFPSSCYSITIHRKHDLDYSKISTLTKKFTNREATTPFWESKRAQLYIKYRDLFEDDDPVWSFVSYVCSKRDQCEFDLVGFLKRQDSALRKEDNVK